VGPCFAERIGRECVATQIVTRFGQSLRPRVHGQSLRCLPYEAFLGDTSYPNDLYAEELRGWHRVDFQGTSHVGSRPECVWLNYTPALLHDTRFIGWDFRGRQSWKRKCARWKRRFSQLSTPEQQCLLSELQSIFSQLTPQS
jgi:hypothetical protein